jgi:hypothetical protein
MAIIALCVLAHKFEKLDHCKRRGLPRRKRSEHMTGNGYRNELKMTERTQFQPNFAIIG